MKRIVLLALAVAAACAVGGATASVSMAEICVRTDEANTGNWTNATCTEKVEGQQKNWIKIQNNYTSEYAPGQWCAELAKGEINSLIPRFENGQCNKLVTEGHFEKVYEHPDWYVNGSQLKQGSRQIKLQLKGKAVLQSELTGFGPITVECGGVASEGTTIEGYGYNQGQGKGRLAITSCTSAVCPVAEPIVTKQLKMHLVTFSGSQTKYAELLSPTEGETFATLKFGGACGIATSITGDIVAEIVPKEKELQEGALIFPEIPISRVIHEGQEVKQGLFFGPKEAKFAGYFGTRLATNERFGVFGSN